MNIIPSELIKDSIDSYIIKYSTTSQKIYWLVLIVIIAALIALPFIYVDVSVQESGIIRPVAEKTEIRAVISEIVDTVFVKEGQAVNQGDTILMLRQSTPDYQIQYQQKRINDFQEHLSDLCILANGEKPKIFSSGTRQQEYAFYTKQKNECETNLDKTKKDLDRTRLLYDKKVVSEEEYEKYQYEHQKAKNELASLKENHLSRWQSDLNTYSNLLEEMQMSMNQGLKSKDLYVVTSPVSGTLDQFRGIYKGSSIQAGSLLAIISPDSTLYAEVYVSPCNIGYIYLGMPVHIQVSSFNYNEWGTILGKVAEISSDFLTNNSGNEAYYKVKCNLEKDYLMRKNGVTGKLKKGMYVSSHFMITERSLFDLIYQKMDDWANPTQYNNNQIAQK
jgi:multidrug resistance efflux pump